MPPKIMFLLLLVCGAGLDPGIPRCTHYQICNHTTFTTTPFEFNSFGATWWVFYRWLLPKKMMNRKMHALCGNGPNGPRAVSTPNPRALQFGATQRDVSRTPPGASASSPSAPVAPMPVAAAMPFDMSALQHMITTTIQTSIAAEVAPLVGRLDNVEHEVAALRQEVSKLRAQSSNANNNSMQRTVDRLERDLFSNRVMFVGWSPDHSEQTRAAAVETFLQKHCADAAASVTDFVTIKKGPKDNRVATSVSYAEFASASMARGVLATCREKELKCGTSSVRIRPPRTSSQLARNDVLKEAEKKDQTIECGKRWPDNHRLEGENGELERRNRLPAEPP